MARPAWDPAAYDAWYATSRGAWIGDTEYRLLKQLLAPHGAETLLDVGCGSGYFSRRFAADGLTVTALDPDPDMLGYAASRRTNHETYLIGDARELPFRAQQFDVGVAITSLCFVADQLDALRELLRVSRHRIAVGLLNRRSLLYLQKGLHGGQGAYRGARWHSPEEARALFRAAGAASPTIRYAIFLPSGNAIARRLEPCVPRKLGLGAFMVAVAGVPEGARWKRWS